jgi:hypothetical protein
MKEMATLIYDGTCKKLWYDLSVWIKVRRNIDGIPKPEI